MQQSETITKNAFTGELVRGNSYINGRWVEGKSDRTYKNVNPYDNSVIAEIKLASKKQVEEAFQSAAEAQKKWAKSSVEERKQVIEKAIHYLTDHREDIVQLISRETGGTLLKANVEHHLAMEVLEEALNYVDEVGNVQEVPGGPDGKINKIYRLPLGVISTISPFNFPVNLSMRAIIPAIALGNAVVHKPDIQVGLVGGVLFAKAFEYAGLPAGVFNLILSDIDEIGDEMLTNPIPRLISFTGSTAVGRHIGSIAGRNLKRVALELGGNSPFVVLADADVDQAVNAAIFGKFIHQGQICMIINRIIVHKDKHDEFVEKFTARAKELSCGNPQDPKTVIGPLINARQLEKAVGFVELAKKEGATMVLEGKREGNVLTPYVFTEVKNTSEIAQTELFAPIALIIKAETDEEAVEMAGETAHGLSSSIFTSDLKKGEQYAVALDTGMTHINDQTVNDAPNIPFGGTKASGLGRFGNPWVVDEYTTLKWVSVQTKERAFPF
ncbi:aldehyde dehydrogenase family protein [Sporosarcina sp. ACRSM]|uniref:aldehyde dehydrogenase family protein n=1 Tax=Sporosarcina sp. ACRSM TaxID=2918216 RepID=UPI001EF641AC|nr:aldehyde dehydrogenase family protein [Sporosarcina sp. ACRSM]MCG7336301.1 aldehyde dehydrogenase family protein [Sporosarcina sp. ACRSM]